MIATDWHNVHEGKIILDNGLEIDVSNITAEMTCSCDDPPEFSFSGTVKTITRKEDKVKKLHSILVRFNGGYSKYEYLINEDGFSKLREGEKILILNESGYDYKNAVVEVLGRNLEPSDAATRQIVAFVVVSGDCMSHGRYWRDSDFFKCDPKKQLEIDSWIDEKCSNINFHNNFCSTMDKTIISDRFAKVAQATSEARERLSQLSNELTINIPNNDNKKGEDKMNIFGNIEFGKVNHRNTYAMTLKGLAYLRSDGTGEKQKAAYVQYDPKTESIEDVTPFVLDNMDARDFVYKMPVATSAVKKGDIILDCSNPVFVKEVKDSTLIVVDPYSCEVKTILAAKNAFGFNFVTKIVNLMDGFNLAGSANAENPFGNLLPLMFLSKDSDMNDILPLLFMSNGSFKSEDLVSNPMMMYFLMKDGKSNDMLPLLFMSNSGLFGAPAKETSNEEV